MQDYEADCTFEGEQTNNHLGYSCEIPAKIENIKSFKISKEFHFSSLPPKTTIKITPLVEIYMNNILEKGDDTFNLLNRNLTLHILEKSKIIKSEKQNFNVSGIINVPKPKFKKINFTLISKAEINKEKNNAELNCSFIDIINNNWTLCCQGDINANYDLQNSMTIIDDEILILNFDENENSNILFSKEKSEISNNKFFRKSKDKNNVLIVIVVVIVIIVVLAAIIATIFIFLRKQKQKKGTFEESSILKVKSQV